MKRILWAAKWCGIGTAVIIGWILFTVFLIGLDLILAVAGIGN